MPATFYRCTILLTTHIRQAWAYSLSWYVIPNVHRALLNFKPGSAWCCFEAHPSPDGTQSDTMAIRIKKMIIPVTTIKPEIALQIPMPREGELVMQYARAQKGMRKGAARTLDSQPWTLDARTMAHPVVQEILCGKRVH